MTTEKDIIEEDIWLNNLLKEGNKEKIRDYINRLEKALQSQKQKIIEEIEKIKNITKKVLIEIFNEWEIDDDTQKWVFEEIDKELLKVIGKEQ